MFFPVEGPKPSPGVLLAVFLMCCVCLWSQLQFRCGSDGLVVSLIWGGWTCFLGGGKLGWLLSFVFPRIFGPLTKWRKATAKHAERVWSSALKTDQFLGGAPSNREPNRWRPVGGGEWNTFAQKNQGFTSKSTSPNQTTKGSLISLGQALACTQKNIGPSNYPFRKKESGMHPFHNFKLQSSILKLDFSEPWRFSSPRVPPETPSKVCTRLPSALRA